MRFCILVLFLLSACSGTSTYDTDTSDKSSVVDGLNIKLERTACFGTCPSYTLEIKGDGSVEFCGGSYVEYLGVQTKKIDISDVLKLTLLIKEADFFNLPSEYRAPVTDMPTYTVQVEYRGKSQKIVDYAGNMVDMPEIITQLENEIDSVAGTADWIGNKGKYLRGTKGFDCRSEQD